MSSNDHVWIRIGSSSAATQQHFYGDTYNNNHSVSSSMNYGVQNGGYYDLGSPLEFTVGGGSSFWKPMSRLALGDVAGRNITYPRLMHLYHNGNTYRCFRAMRDVRHTVPVPNPETYNSQIYTLKYHDNNHGRLYVIYGVTQGFRHWDTNNVRMRFKRCWGFGRLVGGTMRVFETNGVYADTMHSHGGSVNPTVQNHARNLSHTTSGLAPTKSRTPFSGTRYNWPILNWRARTSFSTTNVGS